MCWRGLYAHWGQMIRYGRRIDPHTYTHPSPCTQISAVIAPCARPCSSCQQPMAPPISPSERQSSTPSCRHASSPGAPTHIPSFVQDCGKRYYASNYRAFYAAIKAAWPHLVLVANCDLHEAGPTDMFDWHWYTSASSIFHARPTFDAVPRGPGLPQVFASEYAVFDWGRKPLRPYGNMEVRCSLVGGVSNALPGEVGMPPACQ